MILGLITRGFQVFNIMEMTKENELKARYNEEKDKASVISCKHI